MVKQKSKINDTKQINIRVEKKLWLEFNKVTIELETSMTAVGKELIEKFINKHKKSVDTE